MKKKRWRTEQTVLALIDRYTRELEMFSRQISSLQYARKHHLQKRYPTFMIEDCDFQIRKLEAKIVYRNRRLSTMKEVLAALRTPIIPGLDVPQSVPAT